jgi:transposase-like protein
MEKIAQERAEDQRVLRLVMAMPDAVGRELHEMVVSAGLEVILAMLEEERTELCGERYRHSSTRTASRAGTTRGELELGGRRVTIMRPRVRDVDKREVRLNTWEQLSKGDPLQRRAVEQMVVGVSTRKYDRSLERIDVEHRGTSKSAVSRRFVAMTEASLDKMCKADLKDFDLAVLMIDGLHIDKHVVLVALGIDSGGNKRVLGFHEGATENARSCKELLSNLEERGLPMDRSTLVVIDGSKALRKAINDVFGDRAIVQRCQVHKRRNVVDQLPESKKERVGVAMSQAYRSSSATTARKLLMNLARGLQAEHPSAAASLREGLDETLTVKDFKLPAALARSLSTTNAIENIQSGIRRVCHRVTRWRGGTMLLRWVGTALVEHSRGFRRMRGHAGMSRLVAVLRAKDAPTGAVAATAASA